MTNEMARKELWKIVQTIWERELQANGDQVPVRDDSTPRTFRALSPEFTTAKAPRTTCQTTYPTSREAVIHHQLFNLVINGITPSMVIEEQERAAAAQYLTEIQPGWTRKTAETNHRRKRSHAPLPPVAEGVPAETNHIRKSARKVTPRKGPQAPLPPVAEGVPAGSHRVEDEAVAKQAADKGQDAAGAALKIQQLLEEKCQAEEHAEQLKQQLLLKEKELLLKDKELLLKDEMHEQKMAELIQENKQRRQMLTQEERMEIMEEHQQHIAQVYQESKQRRLKLEEINDLVRQAN